MTSHDESIAFHNYTQKIKEGLRMASGGLLQTGKYLLLIKKNKLWKQQCNRFDQWVKDELSISKSTAYNAINIYLKFGELLESNDSFREIDTTHIIALLPYCPENSTLEERKDLLHLLEHQTSEGIKNQLRELAGKKTSDSECNHSDFKEIRVCNLCGRWLR